MSLGLRVSAAIKNRIDADAHANGRTQSAQAELMLEKLYAYEATLAGMKVTLEEIEAGNVDAALRRRGYHPLRSPHGIIWLPPGAASGRWQHKRD